LKKRIDFGGLLREVFELYREQAGPLITLAALIFLPVSFVMALLNGSNQVAAAIVGGSLTGPTSFLYAGIVAPVVIAARRGGEQLELGGLFRAVGPVALVLAVSGFVWFAAVLIGIALLIVPGLIILTIWSLTPAVLVVERLSIPAAFGRSTKLVRGHGIEVFGIFLALGLGLGIAGVALQGLGSAVAGTAGAFIGNWLGTVLTAPPIALTTTALYLELGPSPRRP
jgi:hypothetical protein